MSLSFEDHWEIFEGKQAPDDTPRNLRRTIAEKDGIIASFKTMVTQKDYEIAELQTKLEAAEKHLEIIASNEKEDAPRFEAAMKNAERYQKLKAIAQNVSNEPMIEDDCSFCENMDWRIGIQSSFIFFDQAVDSLPS